MEIKNTYTCQFCKSEFNSEQEEYIQKGISPVCSYKCKFNVVYNIIKKLPQEMMVFLKDYFHIVCPENKLVFELTKKYLRVLNPVSPDSPFMSTGLSE
jgi:hypothetical protein